MKFLNDLVAEGWERSNHPVSGDRFTDSNQTYLLDVPRGVYLLNVMYDPEGTDNTQVQTCKLTPDREEQGTFHLDYVHQRVIHTQDEYKIEHEVRKQLALLSVEERL